jgi:hypothetical protein
MSFRCLCTARLILPQPTEAVSSSAHSDWQAHPCSSWRYRMNWATPSAMSPTSTAPMTTAASCAAEESRVAVHPRDQAQPVQRRRRGDGDIAGGKPERQLHPAIEPMMNQIEHGFKVDSNGTGKSACIYRLTAHRAEPMSPPFTGQPGLIHTTTLRPAISI